MGGLKKRRHPSRQRSRRGQNLERYFRRSAGRIYLHKTSCTCRVGVVSERYTGFHRRTEIKWKKNKNTRSQTIRTPRRAFRSDEAPHHNNIRVPCICILHIIHVRICPNLYTHTSYYCYYYTRTSEIRA